ncbi:MAG: formylmethanofuran dehydrogenase [Chloroflexi bacterium]|nr:formylmethanofuran dehydrogenase [Chloroflexota bacterium]
MMRKTLQELLDESAARHSHLCPRQVLGVRMGMLAADALGLSLPQGKKRLLVIVESDGCFADGVSVATGATVGHRTLRVEDYGKIAAVFADTKTGRSIRIAPSLDARQRAYAYAPQEKRRYFAQLAGYQVMPLNEMFTMEDVILKTPVEAIISRAGVRVNCDRCGEEIINEREVLQDGLTLCRACAGHSYYAAQPALRRKAENALAEMLA